MKILIGHAYFQYFDPKLEEAMRPYPPLGTLVAAALVREQGHEVIVFDAMLERSTKPWADLLDTHQPDVAVLFEDNFNYLSKMCLSRMRDAAFEMLGAARARSITSVICGSDASDHEREFLDAGADAVISGEGDQALLEALDVLATTPGAAGVAALGAVPSITVVGDDGQLISTAASVAT